GAHRGARALVRDHLGGFGVRRGGLAAAGELCGDSRSMLAEIGASMRTAVSHDGAFVALAMGDAPGAEAALRIGYERLAEMGEKALLADTAAMLAQVLYEQGRTDEAFELTREAEDAGDTDDLSAQIGWRTVRARLLARGAQLAEAKRLSAEAVELAGRTDWLSDRGDALLS